MKPHWVTFEDFPFPDFPIKKQTQINKHNHKSENTTTLTKQEEVGTLGRQESSLIGLVHPLNQKDVVYMFSK